MEILTEHGLVAEVATGTFSFKNKISAASIKVLWDKLSRFINDTLKQQKGVLVPNLGTFSVGPVVGETRKKVRPAFALLETRYAGVSQERPKYAVGGRCPVLQPNYGLLATASAVHRGTCQRLLLELVQRLGAHILAGRTISVGFPGVGRLFTNKAGRIQFDFDPLLREFFELERERVIPEMPAYSPANAGQLEEENAGQLVKGLQQVHLRNPPAVRNRPMTGMTSASPPSPSARVKRHAHAPYRGGLLDLWRLCKSSDRINSGCVPRLDLEQWLYRECAGVLRQVAAATVLELLSINTYGKTGKHILYKPFLDQLEAAIGNVTPVEVSPRSVQSPRRLVEVRVESPASAQHRPQQHEQEEEEEVAEATFSPAAQYQDQAPAQFLEYQHGHRTPQVQQQQDAAQQQHGHQQHQHQQNARSALQSPYAQHPPPPLALPRTPQGVMQAWQGPAHDDAGQEAALPHHYYQNHLSPRSRREYDKFNKLHFEKLEQVRGRDYKRAVTPKVGEDELNRREHQAMRQAGEAVTPAQVLGLRPDPPYSRDTPQPIVSSARRRGSPGPRPQILSLAHESPSATPSPHVPGLPTHHYQPQQRLSTPLQQPQPPAFQQPTPHQHPWLPTPHQQPTPRQGPAGPPQRAQSARQPAQPYGDEDDEPPISQYEIINEADPVLRQRKRSELAQALQRNWSEQIREKERILHGIAVAESQWPYVPTRQPNDKRPSSAVNRPQSRGRGPM